MPAIITHDFFGRDAYDANAARLGISLEEQRVFLLGNQGPDPLFFLVLTPTMKPFFDLGSAMHRIDPALLLVALKESIETLKEDEVSTGRAYLAGFYCHYLLDRQMHPLVYSQQYALCDAGIEGLTRKDGKDVHSEIERDLDEMVLFSKTGQTVATFKPHRDILQASKEELQAIGKMYTFASAKIFRMFPPLGMFAASVKDYRLAMRAFYSPDQKRANVVSFLERRILRRNFSFFKAMSHRSRRITISGFDNREHAVWENPYTHEMSTQSFWDVFNSAQAQAQQDLPILLAPTFDEAASLLLTRGLNFSGAPAAFHAGDMGPHLE